MKLGEDLLKKVNKTYEPASTVSIKYRGNDLVMKTNDDGFPVMIFIGKKDNHGIIKGNRYCRVIKMDKKGQVIKDHWDMKGKAS